MSSLGKKNNKKNHGVVDVYVQKLQLSHGKYIHFKEKTQRKDSKHMKIQSLETISEINSGFEACFFKQQHVYFF